MKKGKRNMSKADETFKTIEYKCLKSDGVIWYQRKITDYVFKDILFMQNIKEISVEARIYNFKRNINK